MPHGNKMLKKKNAGWHLQIEPCQAPHGADGTRREREGEGAKTEGGSATEATREGL